MQIFLYWSRISNLTTCLWALGTSLRHFHPLPVGYTLIFNAILRFLLTHSLMEPSPSREDAKCTATQELPQHFMKSEGSLPCSLIPILSQINPVHTIPFYNSKIHFNIVHLPTSWSFQWSLSFWLSLYIHFLSLSSFIQRIRPGPRFLVIFRNELIF
jgi:hypothetical protein